MRTKTLLIAAAALAAGIVTSQAQVYSQNVVGYVNQTVNGSGAGKYTLIGNPLTAGNNTISNVVQNPTDGTTFFFWNGHGFVSSQFSFGSWDQNATNVVAPGSGVFCQTTAPFTNTWTGTVLVSGAVGSTNVFPSGYSIISSQFPVNGTADTLGLTPALADGDIVYKWNYTNQGYDAYQWAFGSWSSPGGGSLSPSLNPGESAFLSSQNGGTWINTNVIQ